MKTTIEINPALLEEAKRLAKAKKTTLGQVVEYGLQLVIEKQKPSQQAAQPALVTYRGRGLNPEFAEAAWEKIRDTIYPSSGKH